MITFDPYLSTVFAEHRGKAPSVNLAVDSLVKASTPEPVGPHALWKKKGFHLPYYVQHIANDLREKRGMDESRAIAVALGAVKRWARGGGKVDPTTRAAAAKAVAEWEATKARAHSVKSEKNLSVELAGAGWLPGPDAEWRKLVGGKVVSRKPFGQGHHEGVKEASGVAKHHGFTDAQIAEATRQMTARAKERQAADKARHDRGLTGAQAAEEILAKTGHGKATKDTAKADRYALVKHMRAEEQKEAAAVGHTGPIRHGGKAPKETTRPRSGRSGPGRGKQRTSKGLSPGIEAQRQELLKRIAAMTADINARAQGHEKQAAQAHKEGKLGKAFRSLGRAVGLRRALHAHHNAAAGVLLGSTTKGAKLRAHLERAATRQHGKAHIASGKAFGAAAGTVGGATAVTAVYGGMHAAKLFGMSNGDSVPTIDLAGFKASQKRAPVGGPTGGQWTPVGGAAPATPKGTVGVTPALKSWAQKQIGHYPPHVNTAALRTKWDNWFRFLTLPPATQAKLAKANPGKTPKRPVKPPIAQLPFLLSNGGSVTHLNFAGTEPDADDMTGHVRASVPKGHGMRVPNGTEPAKVAKMHGYLHRQGNAKHSHGKTTNMSVDLSKLTTKARKALPSSAFAYVDADGNGHFPIHDAAHVRNALSRIGQGAQHSDKAKKKVLAAAKRMGIGQGANMSITDPTVTALDFAARSLPHAQFPRVQTNPKPARGVGSAMATYRQPVTSTAHAGNEMFPPRARRGGGPGNSVAPYRQPKSGQKPAGVPLGVPKGSGTMQIYTPANPAEHSHVMRALRGARALRRQGRTAQANSVMAGLVRQVTGRARKMPSGERRAHTIREVTSGLAQMAKGVQGITTSGATGVHKGPPV